MGLPTQRLGVPSLDADRVVGPTRVGRILAVDTQRGRRPPVDAVIRAAPTYAGGVFRRPTLPFRNSDGLLLVDSFVVAAVVSFLGIGRS